MKTQIRSEGWKEHALLNEHVQQNTSTGPQSLQ